MMNFLLLYLFQYKALINNASLRPSKVSAYHGTSTIHSLEREIHITKNLNDLIDGLKLYFEYFLIKPCIKEVDFNLFFLYRIIKQYLAFNWKKYSSGILNEKNGLC